MRKNVAGQRVEFSLGKGANRIANPTLAVGDFKVSLDGGAQNNVSTLPTSDAAGKVIWLPTQAETNADTVTFLARDAAGDEWDWLTLSWDTHDSTVLAGLAAQFAAIPAAVWANTTRTLSSYGTLVADIWAYASRTLTQIAAAVVSAVTGSTLNITVSTTFDAMLTGLTIPANWSKIYFTLKERKSIPDAQARIQIVASNPAVPGDGLLLLNGAAGTANEATLTVDQVNGTIRIVIQDDATAKLSEKRAQYYDLKVLLANDTSYQLTESTANTSYTVTRTIT